MIPPVGASNLLCRTWHKNAWCVIQETQNRVSLKNKIRTGSCVFLFNSLCSSNFFMSFLNIIMHKLGFIFDLVKFKKYQWVHFDVAFYKQRKKILIAHSAMVTETIVRSSQHTILPWQESCYREKHSCWLILWNISTFWQDNACLQPLVFYYKCLI